MLSIIIGIEEIIAVQRPKYRYRNRNIMSSLHKKSKLNDDTPAQVMIDEYKGHEDVPKNVTHVRFHTSVVDVDIVAFKGRKQLREVVLNDGLREIGVDAFYGCLSLQSINIPSTVIKIGKYAFMSCTKLKEVVLLNEGLGEIGNRAFANCESLQSITLPSTVTEIDQYLFGKCTNLREVALNEGIKRIKSSVFQDCTSLEHITIPSTVTSIGNDSFIGCTNLLTVVLNDGLERIQSGAFSFTSLEHITMPSTVIEIEQYAFNNCSRLREVVIHNEEVQIGHRAFNECSSLERFKFPRLSTRLDNIIKAGQIDIAVKMDDISAVEWRSGELIILAVSQEIENWGRVETVVDTDKEKLDKIVRLIRYYEIEEATTLFELALWKARIDQEDDTNAADRDACRIEVPGPVKDTILQYLR